MDFFKRTSPLRRPAYLLVAASLLPLMGGSAAAQSVSITFTPPPVSAAAASASPAASPVAAEASPTPSPSTTPVTGAEPSATPSLVKTTGVKLQFLPPPMEGTISLGIYDHAGKLVRTLHRAATGDEFTVAVDGYITRWDGLDDAGKQMPPGHYSAHGYMVGNVAIRAIPLPAPTAGASPSPSSTGDPALYFPNGKPFAPRDKIRIVLVPNPLERDRAGTADIAAEIDATGAAWFALSDGLPLKQISAAGSFDKAESGRSAAGEPVIVYLSKSGLAAQAFEVAKTANMMAFDCGDFELPGK